MVMWSNRVARKTAFSWALTRRKDSSLRTIPVVRISCVSDRRNYSSQSSSGGATPSKVIPSSFLGIDKKCTLTSETFAEKYQMHLLQRALEEEINDDQEPLSSSCSKHIVPSLHPPRSSLILRKRFDLLCQLSHVKSSEAALMKLTDAGIVIPLADGRMIHLRPAQYVEDVRVQEQLTLSFRNGVSVEELQLPPSAMEGSILARLHELEAKELHMRADLAGALRLALQFGRRRYTLGSLVMAVQLAAVARLTFFELDWDTMEPITYCMGVFTTLLLYGFFVWCGREFSTDALHTRWASRQVRRFAPKDFDWSTYDAVCRQLEEERKTLERVRCWMSNH